MRKLAVVLVLGLAAVAHASAPSINVTPNTVEASAATPFNGPVATFTYLVAPSPTPGPWTVSILWGPSGPTSSGTVTGSGPFTISTDPITLPAGDLSPVNISVLDTGSSLAGFGSGVAHVHDLHPSPPSLTSTESVQFSDTNVCSFNDSASGAPADYTAVIDWGDGTTSSGTITGGPQYTVGGTHTWTFEGSYDVSCTFHQTASGATVTVPGNAQVATTDSFPTVTLADVTRHWGEPFGVLMTVTDSNLTTPASHLASSAFFSDSNGSVDCTVTGGSGTFQATCDHPAKGFPGGFAEFCVRIFENSSGGADTFNHCGEAKIVNGPMTASPQSIGARPNVGFSGIVGALNDANPLATEQDFKSVTIDWGDGSATSSGSVARNGSAGYFVIEGTHTWATTGSFTVKAVVLDNFGESVTVSSTANVSSNPITLSAATLTVRQNVASTVEVGHFTQLDLGSAAGDFTATIDWGDGSTVDNAVLVGARGDFAVTGTHTYAQAGQYATTLHVTDTRSGGGTATAKGTINVNDANLNVKAPGGLTAHAGEKLNFSFTFTDADAGATAAKYAIDVDWGDPTTSTPATVTAAGGGGFSASADHTYSDAGDFDLVVTISNALAAGGATTIYTFTVKVTVLAGGDDMGGTTNGGGNGGGSCSCDVGRSGAPTSMFFLLFVALLSWRGRRSLR